MLSGTNLESDPCMVVAKFVPGVYCRAGGSNQLYPDAWAMPKEGLVLNLPKAGPVAVHSITGNPKCDGVEFTDLEDGIFQANLPVGVVNIAR